MGIGDSISKAADNAMKDLADNAPPSDDGHTPEPDARDGDVQVHSSISEGSNAMDGDEEERHSPANEPARKPLAGDPAGKLDPEQGVSGPNSSRDDSVSGA